MTLAKRATNGDVIWMHRSVERVESSGDGVSVDDKFAAGVHPVVTRDPKANNAPILDVQVRLELRSAAVDATFDIIARFVFGDDVDEPEDAEVQEFLRDYGIDYAFGFIRTALADDMRIFGFPPAILPVTALDEAKTSDLTPLRSKSS